MPTYGKEDPLHLVRGMTGSQNLLGPFTLATPDAASRTVYQFVVGSLQFPGSDVPLWWNTSWLFWMTMLGYCPAIGNMVSARVFCGAYLDVGGIWTTLNGGGSIGLQRLGANTYGGGVTLIDAPIGFEDRAEVHLTVNGDAAHVVNWTVYLEYWWGVLS